MNCWICNSPSGARIFAIHVDGEPLRLQPVLCGAHGDAYLLRVGRVIGELLRDHIDLSQSGHTISAGPESDPGFFAPFTLAAGPERPLPNKSGRSEGPSCDAYAVKLVGQDRFYCDRGADHQGRPHHNANVGEWTDARIDSGKAR